GQCLLIVESKAHYANSSLSWLLNDPSAESAQVWPQASECGESAARPLPSATPTSTPSPTPIRVSAPQIEQAEGIALVNANLRSGQCLLIVESKAHYANSSLSWLLNDPSAESAQVWPQASECGESAARPLPSATPTSTPSPTPIRVSAPQIEQAEGIALVNANL